MAMYLKMESTLEHGKTLKFSLNHRNLLFTFVQLKAKAFQIKFNGTNTQKAHCSHILWECTILYLFHMRTSTPKSAPQ